MTWTLWHLKSPTTQLSTEQLFRLTTKIQAPWMFGSRLSLLFIYNVVWALWILVIKIYGDLCNIFIIVELYAKAHQNSPYYNKSQFKQVIRNINKFSKSIKRNWNLMTSQIARFMGPTWGPYGSCRPQVDPKLIPWTLISGMPWRAAMTQTHGKFYHINCNASSNK